MNVFWTATAKETYLYIIDYLEEVWGKKYVSKFIRDTEKILRLIASHPEIYEVVFNQNDVRSSCS